MFLHARAVSKGINGDALNAYAKEKGAEVIQTGRLCVMVFGRRVLVRLGRFILGAFEKPEQIQHTENRLQSIVKEGKAFHFSGSHTESESVNIPIAYDRGAGIWFVHAPGTLHLDQRLERRNMRATRNQAFTVWTEEKARKRSLLAIERKGSVLVAGAAMEDVQRLSCWLGMTRQPEKIALPSPLASEVLARQRRQQNDELLA